MTEEPDATVRSRGRSRPGGRRATLSTTGRIPSARVMARVRPMCSGREVDEAQQGIGGVGAVERRAVDYPADRPEGSIGGGPRYSAGTVGTSAGRCGRRSRCRTACPASAASPAHRRSRRRRRHTARGGGAGPVRSRGTCCRGRPGARARRPRRGPARRPDHRPPARPRRRAVPRPPWLPGGTLLISASERCSAGMARSRASTRTSSA